MKMYQNPDQFDFKEFKNAVSQFRNYIQWKVPLQYLRVCRIFFIFLKFIS